RRLDTDPAIGLKADEVERRLAEHGPNELEQAEGRSALAILLAQFKSLIVALLVAATAIAFVMGENLEGIAILVVILLNAAVGFFTEWKAQVALTALRRQAVPTAHVLRDAEEHEIAAAELVPGDIVLVDAGSRIPADGRVIESAQLQVAEASLTGESHAVAKGIDPVGDPNAPLGDRMSMVYMGTAVTDGRGKFVVTSTGSRTEVGHIGTMIEEAGTRETPLERKLAQLGNSLVGV